MPDSRIFFIARTSATKPPVIDAVRVPPSAWMTSQSTQIVRSPSRSSRATERSVRPIRRWISCVRPPTLPAEDSRCVRVVVARGSIPYSAVTQPLPCPRRNGGTRSSMEAAQITRVLPTSMRTEPSGCNWKWGVMRVRRRSPGDRESARAMGWSRSLRSGWTDERAVGRQRPAEVDVPGQGIDFLAVDQDLDAGDRRQVDGQGVDDGVDGEQLVERPARVRAGDLARQIDIRRSA